jgi:hypothetical protein
MLPRRKNHSDYSNFFGAVAEYAERNFAHAGNTWNET